MYLRGLKGLSGINALSGKEYSQWYNKYKGVTLDQLDRIYKNNQFVKKYGRAAFDSYDANQRDEILRKGFINEAIVDTYSPYTNKKGVNGRYIIDPNKGVGDESIFQRISLMDDDSKLSLLRSGWKTTPQINTFLKEEQKKRQKINNSVYTALAPHTVLSLPSNDPAFDKRVVSDNNQIFEKIWANDLKKKEKELQPDIINYKNNVISKLNDTQVKTQFLKAITPEKGKNVGNSQFAAFFHDGKNIEDEVKNFSIDDMRNYLAKEAVFNERLGAGVTTDALNNYAKEYINDHQSLGTYTGLLAKDIGISVLSYSADKLNSFRLLYDLTQGDSNVWIDNQGNVVAPNKVKTAKDGSKYYINDDGESTKIKQTRMSVADLDYLGKDAQGNTRDALWNNQYWSDAEQYGTLDWDLQKQYKKLGASPYKVVYKPGDESDLFYETAKMLSFGIADVASTFIPVIGQSLGSAMQIAKASSAVSKAFNAIGKGVYYAGKAAQAVQPTMGAVAIGHAYGRGVFGEALSQNMQQLEESTYNHAQKNVLNSYNTNKKFKAQVDKDIQAEFRRLKTAQKTELKASGNSEGGYTDEELMDISKQTVFDSYINRGAKDIQNSDQYYDMVGQAAESASDGAMIASITDAAKYTIVNNFGYRKFLFNNSADRAASAFRRMKEYITEAKNGTLNFKSILDGNKLKTIGKMTAAQAWGGGWTNFTDEMQSWGGKQINQDRFSEYLKGAYNGEADDTTYGAMDAVASYIKGGRGALDLGTTWKAGLVGALGSITSFVPNPMAILNIRNSRGAREAWRKADNRGKIKMLLEHGIISNGIINNYYAKKQGEAQIQEQVNNLNKLLDEQENFSILRKAVALDLASIDATNQEDKNVLTFLKALNSISLLHQFQEDAGVGEQAGSKIKRWFKKRFGEQGNAIAEQSSILTKAMIELQELSQDNLSEDAAREYLTEYYAKHPTVEQSAENNEKALQEIYQNANTLLEAENTWQDVNSKLNEVEQERGVAISQDVRGVLLERAALDGFLAKRIGFNEKKISGREEVNSDRSFNAAVWGTKEAIEQQIAAIEKTQEEADKLIEDSKSKLDDATSRVKEFEESHDMDSLRKEDITDYNELISKRDAAKLQYEYSKNNKDILLSRKTKMETMSNDAQEAPVLSKEEILSLHPEDRARMLDDTNRSNYSKEQLEVIDNLKKELTLKDPSILQTIEDQAILMRHKDANASAYEMMLNNPEAAASEFEARDGIEGTINKNSNFVRVGDKINSYLGKLQTEERIDDDTKKAIVYRGIREYHPTLLNYLLKNYDKDKRLSNLSTYGEVIKKAIEWSKMTTDIDNALEQMNLDDSIKKAFRNNIDNLINEADSTNSAMEILKKVSESAEVSNEDQAKFKKLLNIINGVEEQKKSTKTESKEEKRAREKSQETQTKQEEKKVQDAEKEVEIKSSAKNGRTYWEAFKEVGFNEGEHAGSIENNPANKTAGVTSTLSHAQAEVVRRKTRNVFEDAANSDRQRLHDAVTSNAHATSANVNLLKYLYAALDAVKEGRMSADEAMAIVEYHLNAEDSTHKEFIANLHSQRSSQLVKETRNTQEAIEVTAKEKSNEENAQEAYQETERERSNEKNAQEVYTETEQERSNQEEAEKQIKTYNQTEEEVIKEEEAKKQVKEGLDHSSETVDLESPNWKEQVEQAKKEGYKVEEGLVAKDTPDTTDQGNIVADTTDNMLGNTMYGYDVTSLKEDAKEVERTGKDPNDTMSKFFNWFKNAGIKLQEIIDNELKDIVKANNKIEVLYINPQKNATDDAALKKFTLLCVEYTDAVKKVHKEDRGGVITANGKKYLIIGSLGFNKFNRAQGDAYRSALALGKERFEYFKQNPSERFYVSPIGHTEIEQMTSGRIVREMIGDKETKVRPITELLSDAKRNPKGLKLEDLKWGIMYEDGLHYVNISERNTVYPPRDTQSNLGAVFLLMEAANGNYIPVAIAPTMLSDLHEGSLKSQLNELFNELTSVKYSDRRQAINKLVQLLNLNSEGDNILIGKEDSPTISTVKGGTVLRTFNLKDPNFSRIDLISAIEELNPRVNITLSTLSDPVQLRMYAEAGALNTDIAKLNTSNASYTVYAMDGNGNPIKTTPVENHSTNLKTNSDLEKADYKKKHSVYYKGLQYREKKGKWYDVNWKEVKDPVLLNQIKWSSYIRANDLSPDMVSNDKYGNKEVKYYIIDSNESTAKVLKVFKSGAIAELSIEESRAAIDIIEKKETKANQERIAKEEKERIEKESSSLNPIKQVENDEIVDLGETLTEEQLLNQSRGDFSSLANSQESNLRSKDKETQTDTSKQSTPTNEDINKTGHLSLASLKASSDAEPTNASSILKHRKYSKRVREILRKKGFKGKPSEVEVWLKQHNMPIGNIEDVNSWIDMLENCR